jgi:glutamate racemase
LQVLDYSLLLSLALSFVLMLIRVVPAIIMGSKNYFYVQRPAPVNLGGFVGKNSFWRTQKNRTRRGERVPVVDINKNSIAILLCTHYPYILKKLDILLRNV